MTRTALVSGGNRGIGLEVCRQLGTAGLSIVMGSRDAAAGERAAESLREAGMSVRVEALDVSDEASVRACASRLAADDVAVDVLVNNAGVNPEGALLSLPTSTLEETLGTNLYGAFRLCRAFVPGMVERGSGRVVNVSSTFGSFAKGLPGSAAYSISKASLNALTVKLAQEVSGDVKVNSASPGWVQSDMGGPNAVVSLEDGADTIVWLATLGREGPQGGFFHERRSMGW